MATTSDLAKDVVLKWKGDLFGVVEFQHVNPGKGAAFVRTRLKSLSSGKVIENTFKAGEAIDVADVERKKMQFLYKDASGATFMDNTTYDQVVVPALVAGDKMAYLQEGSEATVVVHEGAAVNIEIPRKMTLKVVEAAPGVRGDTATNVTKEVKLENGMTVRTPLFIKEGDSVIVNTESGDYVERA